MAEEKKPHDMDHNHECKSESHFHHLCYLISQGDLINDVEKFNSLVKDPRYKCLYCGRVARDLDNLCVPEEL